MVKGDGYELEGRFDGNQVIRLNEPLRCPEGPVRVIVTPLAAKTEQGQQNRAALEALHHLLAEPDDLTQEKWMELEKLMEEHPLTIRKGSLA